VIRGLYISASGMLAQSAMLDATANNLANAETTGFKKTEPTTQPFVTHLLNSVGVGVANVGPLAMGAELSGTALIDRQGNLETTGNQLDLALVGTGWFAVDTAAGRRYTRDGSFTVDTEGTLVDKLGNPVAGEGGPITLGDGPVKVRDDGTVVQNGVEVGTLEIAALDPESIVREGTSLVDGELAGIPDATVRQGHLEGSAVQVVEEMVDLIRVMRSFESNQRAMQAQDETLGEAVNRVGRVG